MICRQHDAIIPSTMVFFLSLRKPRIDKTVFHLNFYNIYNKFFQVVKMFYSVVRSS